MPEAVLLGGVLFRALAGGLYFIHPHRDAKGGVNLCPHLGVGPVVIILCPVDHGIEGEVMFPTLEDVQSFLVRLGV